MDAIAGRILVGILGAALGLWVVVALDWDDKVDRFIMRAAVFMMILRGVASVAFDWLGLFP
jgi:hypothetical protein